MIYFQTIFHVFQIMVRFSFKRIKKGDILLKPYNYKRANGDFNSGLHIPSILYALDKEGKNNNSSIFESIKKNTWFMA